MYSKFLRKANAAIMAAALAANCAVFYSSTVVAADNNKFEFESAEVTGDVTVEKDADASGGSYLKMTESGTINLTFNVDEEGMYKLTIHAGGIGSAKQQNLSVNGASQGTLAIPESDGFEEIAIPSIKLKKGENVITIEKSWGWSTFDYVTVEKAVLPAIKATQTSPVDIKASAETRSLMSYLAGVYGNGIISGQQEIYKYGPHDLETEFEYLNDLTGHYPAIRGFDYGNFCCPAFGSDDGSTDRIIDWVKNRNGIATASFHLNVPKDFAGYKSGSKVDWAETTYNNKDTDFSPEKAATPGTKENEYYLQALTTLAKEFNKLEKEGIPVIWRPLHEAEGGGGETGSWFWWGREGSAAYKKLWIYTYETLTNDLNCHNLIWEWNSYNFDTSKDWYPGDEYVDIIGYDKYNCTVYLQENNWQPSLQHNDSAISPTFYGLMEKYDSAKMISMAENDCFSTVGNLTSEKAGWLYFCTWYDGGSDDINFLSNPVFNTKQDTIDMYQSEYCITLDELPKDLYSKDIPAPDPAMTTTKPVTTAPDPSVTTTTTTAAFKFKAKSYKIDLPEASERGTLTLVIEGAPTASIGGGIGYGTNADDWKNLEWKGNADADGNLTVDIDISEIPEDFKTVEAQIWWSNVWDAATEKANDTDCDLTDHSFKKSVEDTTVEPSLLGDANLDNDVSLSDALAILQYVANAKKYPLTPVALSNADVYNRGDGITGNDALTIQKLDAKVISELPYTE